jgi:hypothetical protein
MKANNEQTHNLKPRLMLLVGIFDNEREATNAVEKLLEEDFPADRISLLQKASGHGDDMLGLSYSNAEQRVKVWSKQGMVWGALWGLLTGVSGLFILPGMGALVVAGPIVEALGGAVAGATLGGGAMAGAAILTELASALHELGIPKEELALIHQRIEQGHYLVILHGTEDEAKQYRIYLKWAGAEPVMNLPILV